MDGGQVDFRELFEHAKTGDAAANDRLYRAVEPHLRGKAARLLADESPGNSVQVTMLVDDAFMTLLSQRNGMENLRQYRSLAARMMRRFLADHARKKARLKHGGGHQHV